MFGKILSHGAAALAGSLVTYKVMKMQAKREFDGKEDLKVVKVGRMAQSFVSKTKAVLFKSKDSEESTDTEEN